MLITCAPLAKTLIKLFAKEKRLVSRDLPGKIKDAQITADVGGSIGESLEWLRKQGLIEKQEAPIADFDTYYVTADGLAANNTLEKIEPVVGKSFLSRFLT